MSETGQNTELSPDGEALKNVLEAAKLSPEILEKQPHLKEFFDRMGGQPPATEPPSEGGQPPAGQPPAGAQAPTIKVEGPLSKTVITPDTAGGAFPSLDAAADVISTKFGIQKGDKQFDTFFDSVDKWRKDSTGYAGVSKKYNDLDNSLNQIPTDLKIALTNFFEGKPYRDVFSGLDYSKPVDNYSNQELLNTYFPGQFTKEDVDDIANNDATKRSLNIARQSFTNDKRTYDLQASQAAGSTTNSNEFRITAANESVNNFKQAFPDASSEVTSKISDMISNGDDSQVLGLFFEPSGVLRKDAATKLSYVLYAEQELQAKDKIIQELTASLKGTGKVNPTNLQGGQAGNKLSPDTQRGLGMLSGFQHENTY